MESIIQLSRSFIVFTFLWVFFITNTQSQKSIDEEIADQESFIESLDHQKEKALEKWEQLKLSYVSEKLNEMGVPSIKGTEVQLIKHRALQLGYDEKHEQARWVMHMVLPDVIDGNVSRTNDFREDPLIESGTAVKADYWYSGYDRGHLAPSADFRWSQIALSESYFYSNMSPQLPELNREKWAELENLVRDYVISHKEAVYVITGPILHDSLPIMKNEGRENSVSIPEMYFKAIIDITGAEKSGIGFIVPNGSCNYPITSYAVSINEIENLTGMDFFASLPDSLEKVIEQNSIVEKWIPQGKESEATPINPTKLPKGKINTVQAKYNIGSQSCVCGTVVSTKYSKKSGNTFLNLDKKFPNQIFSVMIDSKNRSHFSYLPEEELYHKKICITGKLELSQGTPTMRISNEKSIEFLNEIDESGL